MAEKTAAPHSRYTRMRRASSAKRPLSSLRCRERQPRSRWPGIIRISAPLARRTATSSSSETPFAGVRAPALEVPVLLPSYCTSTAASLPCARTTLSHCSVFEKWHNLQADDRSAPHLWTQVAPSSQESRSKASATHFHHKHVLSSSCSNAVGVKWTAAQSQPDALLCAKARSRVSCAKMFLSKKKKKHSCAKIKIYASQ